MTDQTRTGPEAGLGIDFGATALRAAVCARDEASLLPAEIAVPGERATLVLGAERAGAGRWLRLETVKASLGTGRPGCGERGVVESSQARALAQLRALRANLESYLRAEIVGAAVGVPACYGINQRGALRSIAISAGLGSVSLVDESVAAALHSYRERIHGGSGHRPVLVYCLGRSVFAASALEIGGGRIQELAHAGSTQLGGQDFDAVLVEDLVRSLRAKRAGLELDEAPLRELLRRAEQARIALSATPTASLEVWLPPDAAGQGRLARWEVSRANLEALIAPLVAQTVAYCRQAVQEAGLETRSLAEVLLVGGATRTPLVVEELRRAFGCPITSAPDDAVACGAARYAAIEGRGVRSVGRSRIGDRGSGPLAPATDDALATALREARGRLRAGDLEAGIAALESLLDQTREELSYVYSKRASELRQAGRQDEARARLERGHELWPGNVRVRQALAEVHAGEALEALRAGVTSRCKEELRRCRELDPDNASAGAIARELEQLRQAQDRRGKRPPGKAGRR